MLLALMAAASGLLADAEGAWSGALQYRDYRSDKLVEIPVAVENELHGALFISKLNFTDPGRQVYRVAVTSYDEATGKAYEAYIRDGGVERYVTDFVMEETESGWTITRTREGEDADTPAIIRDVTTYTGDTLVSERTVDPLGDGEDEFLFRNRTVLTRGE